MPAPTDGQLLHWISDQVQRLTCLEVEDANHYAGGLLTGWRLGRADPEIDLQGEADARVLAVRAIAADRAAMEIA